MIEALKEKLHEAQRKIEQKSQQLQGEVMELDFEQRLRTAFPFDRINEIPKGMRGADVSQEVSSSTGKSCGIILYENKRTTSWSDSWVMKLKGDIRHADADIGVIVTEAMPANVDRFCERDGVWVTDPKSAIPLAHALRFTLQQVSITRGYRDGAKEKMELLYSYVTGKEFRHRVCAVIDAFKSMYDDSGKERRAFADLEQTRKTHQRRDGKHGGHGWRRAGNLWSQCIAAYSSAGVRRAGGSR